MAAGFGILVSLIGLSALATDLDGYDGSNNGGSQQQQQQPPQQQFPPSPQPSYSGYPLPSPQPSCSTYPSPSPSSSPSPVAEERIVYFANLYPMNGSDVSGRVGIVVDGGSVGISLQAFGLAARQSHGQYLSSSTSCSTEQESSSHTAATSSNVYSGANATTFALQLPSGSFPVSSAFGNLTYVQSFPESSVIDAMGSSQIGIQQAGAGRTANSSSNSLGLDGKTVEIGGVDSRPIACGQLYRSLQ